MKRFLDPRSLLLAAITLVGATYQADALEYEVPAWAGDADTEYAEWLNLSVAVGDNNPDVEGSTGDGVLSQAAEGAIVTGSMNIYNPVGASFFTVTDSVDGTLQTVVFQAWVSGTELDYDGLVLEYEGGDPLVATRTELGRESGGQGDTVVSKWAWDVSALDISGFTISFASTGAHDQSGRGTPRHAVRSDGTTPGLRTSFVVRRRRH